MDCLRQNKYLYPTNTPRSLVVTILGSILDNSLYKQGQTVHKLKIETFLDVYMYKYIYIYLLSAHLDIFISLAHLYIYIYTYIFIFVGDIPEKGLKI